ncbi:MAG: hypothetical protein GXP02_03490, partial [Alphaproteobacteria bacterium]|nr:hypothetical protein [Alphaproteobacteria bacterium]
SVAMTSNGRRILKHAIAIHKEWVDELLGSIDKDKTEELITLFSSLKNDLADIEA